MEFTSNDSKASQIPASPTSISLAQAALYWLKLGFISFGGPAGQIAIMHHDLVEKKRWISEKRFLHALNYCMILPGPEAQQLATYVGWLLHRMWRFVGGNMSPQRFNSGGGHASGRKEYGPALIDDDTPTPPCLV